jgi:hypothetical protein
MQHALKHPFSREFSHPPSHIEATHCLYTILPAKQIKYLPAIGEFSRLPHLDNCIIPEPANLCKEKIPFFSQNLKIFSSLFTTKKRPFWHLQAPFSNTLNIFTAHKKGQVI